MLISPEYAALNAEHHLREESYGFYGGNAEHITYIADVMQTKDVLDYGCGKGRLGRTMPWPIKEYDPAIPGKTATPEPADLVICRDVIEHIEPECLHAVLTDLARCVKRLGILTTGTGPSWDVLPDGRNAHLLQRPAEWWGQKLSEYFRVVWAWKTAQITGKEHCMFIGGFSVVFVVKPKVKEAHGNGQ